MPRQRREKKRCSTINFFELQLSKLQVILQNKTRQGVNLCAEAQRLPTDCDSHELIDRDIIKDNSYKSYAKQFRGFFNFLALIGDYESLLLFLNEKNKQLTQSMVAESVALYILYKTKESTEYLTKLDNPNQRIKDIFQRDIKCRGEWKSRVNHDQFLNAITALHAAIRQSGRTYSEPCPECLRLSGENENSTGCFHHRGEYRFYRRGNPRYSPDVKKAVCVAEQETRSHKSRKCPQLLPVEVERLRVYLTATNKLADYQMYVLILIGIHLFLRFDEVTNLSFDHYLPEYTVVRQDGYIERLLFKVKGKADKHDVLLSLTRTDEFPKTCPIRNLLYYLFVCNISQGYIFPDLIRQNGKKYEYAYINSTMKTLINDHLGRSEHISTHVLRNTGYLFAKFGEGTFELIQRAARHKSKTVAVSYYSDAETLFNSIKGTEAAVVNRVPKWNDIWVNNMESYRTIHGGTLRSLPQLAKMFAEEVFLGNSGARQSDTSSFIDLKKNLERLVEKDNQRPLVEQLRDSLQKEGATQAHIDIAVAFFHKGRRNGRNGNNENISTNSRSVAPSAPTQHFDNVLRPTSTTECTNSTQQLVDLVDEVEDQPGAQPKRTSNKRKQGIVDVAEDQSGAQPKRPKYKRKEGTVEIKGQDAIKDIKPNDRLLFLVQLYEEYGKVEPNSLVGKSRTFFYNVLIPVNNCFRRHCNGDVSAFYEKHTLKNYSRFQRGSCNGKGDTCNIRLDF